MFWFMFCSINAATSTQLSLVHTLGLGVGDILEEEEVSLSSSLELMLIARLTDNAVWVVVYLHVGYIIIKCRCVGVYT